MSHLRGHSETPGPPLPSPAAAAASAALALRAWPIVLTHTRTHTSIEDGQKQIESKPCQEELQSTSEEATQVLGQRPYETSKSRSRTASQETPSLQARHRRLARDPQVSEVNRPDYQPRAVWPTCPRDCSRSEARSALPDQRLGRSPGVCRSLSDQPLLRRKQCGHSRQACDNHATGPAACQAYSRRILNIRLILFVRVCAMSWAPGGKREGRCVSFSAVPSLHPKKRINVTLKVHRALPENLKKTALRRIFFMP